MSVFRSIYLQQKVSHKKEGKVDISYKHILLLLKFRYSEKATKFWKNLPILFDVTNYCQI